MVELKKLTPEAIPSALEKATRYRLLKEPDEVESICLDILEITPDHQDALILLLLAVTDKFQQSGLNPYYDRALKIVSRLSDAYCKSYYSGMLFEQRAKYHINQNVPGCGKVAYDWFLKAMQAYEEALAGCDPDNQDALLRWNSCARFINRHPEGRDDEDDRSETPLDTYDTPH